MHRTTSLAQAVPSAQTRALSAAPLLSDLIASHRRDPLLIGSDEKSAQWVRLAAERHGFAHAVCHKSRQGDHAVTLTLPHLAAAGRQVLLLDDVVSTGQTVALACQKLLAAGAVSVDLAVTHALFVNDALALVRQAGIGSIWRTDSIEHPSNAVSLGATFAQALDEMNSES